MELHGMVKFGIRKMFFTEVMFGHGMSSLEQWAQPKSTGLQEVCGQPS